MCRCLLEYVCVQKYVCVHMGMCRGIYVCMGVCKSMCMYMGVYRSMCVHGYRGQRLTTSVFFYHSPTFFLIKSIFLWFQRVLGLV